MKRQWIVIVFLFIVLIVLIPGVGWSQAAESGSPARHLVLGEGNPSVAAGATAIEMIPIPAGEFKMGCDPANPVEECADDEQPLHSIYLNDYSIYRYEVTNAQYKSCVDAGSCTAPNSIASYTRDPYYGSSEYADYPVLYVSWNNATQFCEWAGGRLPTEAEWEKAARGSQDTRMYPWGNEDPNCTLLNYIHVYSYICHADTNQVGSYPLGASPYGVMDMAGNVSEFVSDWYDSLYYESSPDINPTGPDTGTFKVHRGGAWNYSYPHVRVASRSIIDLDTGGFNQGFRCVVDGLVDIIPPAAITDLVASTGSIEGSIALTWTAPGDDGNSGTASSYIIRSATSPILSESDWENGIGVTNEPAPKPAGSQESITIGGYSPGEKYYFAIKTQDEVPNTSGLSNSPGAVAKGTDTTPPAAITDLAASTGSADGTVDLTWTALGDDGNTGTALFYTIKYATSAITTEDAWSNATYVNNLVAPKAAGSPESYTVSGLTPGRRYYFSVRAVDDVLNEGGLSNSPSALAGGGVVQQSGFVYLPLITKLPSKPAITVSVVEHVTKIDGLVQVPLTDGGLASFKFVDRLQQPVQSLRVTSIENELGVTLIVDAVDQNLYPKIVSYSSLEINNRQINSETADSEIVKLDPYNPVYDYSVNAEDIELIEEHLEGLPSNSEHWEMISSKAEDICELLTGAGFSKVQIYGPLYPIVPDQIGLQEVDIGIIEHLMIHFVYEVVSQAVIDECRQLLVGPGPSDYSLYVNRKYGNALIHAPDTVNNDIGEIFGQVVDFSTKYGVEGATVTLDGSYTTNTLPNGWYRIPGVDPGVRFIDGAKNGYLGDFVTVLVEPIFVVQAPALELRVASPGYLKIKNETGFLSEVAIYGYGNVIIEKDETFSWELPAGNYQLTAWEILCLEIDHLNVQIEAGKSEEIALTCDTPINSPPYSPSNPIPPASAINQNLNVDLSWTGGDPDGDTVTYDIYFEAGNASPSVVEYDQSAEIYDPGVLSPNTHYYWKIIAKDEHGEITAGPVWDFITGDGGAIPEEWVTKFQGNVSFWYCDENFFCGWDIQVQNVLLGPELPDYVKVPTTDVFYVCAGGGHLDDVNKGDTVEVYGLYKAALNKVYVCMEDYYMRLIP